MVQDTTVPYEILIRFDDAGNVQGAHYQTRRIIVLDDKTRLPDQISPPMFLSLVDNISENVLQKVLGAALMSALQTVEVQTQSLVEHKLALDELTRIGE